MYGITRADDLLLQLPPMIPHSHFSTLSGEGSSQQAVSVPNHSESTVIWSGGSVSASVGRASQFSGAPQAIPVRALLSGTDTELNIIQSSVHHPNHFSSARAPQYVHGLPQSVSGGQATPNAAAGTVGYGDQMQATSFVVADVPAHPRTRATSSRFICNNRCGVPCQQSFTREGSFRRHVLEQETRRTGELPHICACGMRFMRTDELKKHEQKENHS